MGKDSKQSIANQLSNNANLILAANERKMMLINLERTDSNTALKFITQAQSYLQSNNNCIERLVQLEGSIALIHKDDFTNKKTDIIPYFIDKDSHKYLRHLANTKDLHSFPQVNVSISGYVLDNDLIIDSSLSNSIVAKPQTKTQGDGLHSHSSQALAVDGNTGEQKVAIVLNKYADYTNPYNIPEPTYDQVSNVYFNDVSNYYKTVSYNKVSLNGTVFPPKNLDGSTKWNIIISSSQSCDLYSIAQDSLESIKDKLFDSNNQQVYTRLVVVFPTDKCQAGGIGTLLPIGFKLSNNSIVNVTVSWIGSSTSWDSTSNYSSQFYGYERTKGVAIHEFGHNFGFHHSNFLDCHGKSILSNDCNSLEYADYFDVMGANVYGELNAVHKDLLGWFKDNNGNSHIQNVTSSGDFIIYPIETSLQNCNNVFYCD